MEIQSSPVGALEVSHERCRRANWLQSKRDGVVSAGVMPSMSTGHSQTEGICYRGGIPFFFSMPSVEMDGHSQARIRSAKVPVLDVSLSFPSDYLNIR